MEIFIAFVISNWAYLAPSVVALVGLAVALWKTPTLAAKYAIVKKMVPLVAAVYPKIVELVKAERAARIAAGKKVSGA